MTFSVIIPAYNEEKYIARCLHSISGLKKPVGCSFEVIVVNNASTDRTAETAHAALPEARIINEPKKGLTRAYNRGAREARGEILFFVDADMILSPSHLEKIAEEFKRDPRLAVLSGPYRYKDAGFFGDFATRFVYLFFAMPAEFIFVRLLNVGASMASGNSAVRRSIFEKLGGFNEKIFYGLETEFALRAKKIGKVRFKYYLSTESSSRRLKKEGVLKTIFRHIANIIWPLLFGRPLTKSYIDIR